MAMQTVGVVEVEVEGPREIPHVSLITLVDRPAPISFEFSYLLILLSGPRRSITILAMLRIHV